jgi:hypothetical protein
LSLRFFIPYIKISLLTSTAESYSKEYHFDCSLLQSLQNYAKVEHVFHDSDSNRGTVFSMWSLARCYKGNGLGQLVSCKSVKSKVRLWREDFRCDV